MAEMLGYTMDTMAGHPLEEFMFKEDWPDHQDRLTRRQFNEATRYERRLCRKDGGELWIIMSATVTRDAAGNFTGAFGMATDITERKRAEEKLLLQSSALMASANAIVITDTAGRIEWVNPAFTRLTGYAAAEALGKNVNVLKSGRHAPEFYRELWDTVRAGKIWQGEITNQRQDGSLYNENMTIAPVRDTAGKILHYVAIKEDVTERRALESRLQQAQKMEAVSQLAGGIAHEFNNIFTVIMGHANLLKSSGRLAAEDAATAAEISAAVRRAAGVTRQLLIFSRQQPVHLKPINLNQIINHQFNILKHLLGEKISIQQHLADALPVISADATMMEQIIVELATRARQAMPAGGHLTLTTQAVELARVPNPASSEARAGRFVRLTVADSGLELDTQEMRRIFEPFFEGPHRHRPANLGLATVYGIVKEHRGWVEVCSRANEGTTFNIFLPVAETPAVASGETMAPVPALAAAETKTILLVEDDPALRKLAGAYLRQLNYQVLAAADSLAAERLWREHSGAIDLLFTDVILPGELDGRELARRFQRERAGLKIIFTTGYSRECAGGAEIFSAAEICLPKPYEPEMLAQVVWQALAAPARLEP
jgi:PAS domain S-box-containing protein